jgi:competence protein ComEC
MQGLADVANNFDVGSVLVGATPFDDRDFSELMRVAVSRKLPVSSVHRGNQLNVGGTRIQVFSPRTDIPSGTSANNSSVVTKLSYGDVRILLTGDIEREVEAELLLDPSCDLEADVVKVPHHGSRTSSTEAFVQRVSAGTAVISVGRRSPFGHPHAEVVARWRNSGANVLTTGERGTITVSTDGSNVELQRFVP